MSGIESEVLETFMLQLEGSGTVASAVIKGLRSSLGKDKLPKPEQLVALYAASSGDSLA